MGEPGSRRRLRAGRTSHWDRPPPPHDLRWAVSLVGKVFVVTGLLMLAFVAYQLWGTGIETSRAQRSLESEFEELLASSPTTPSSPTSPGTDSDTNGGSRPTSPGPTEPTSPTSASRPAPTSPTTGTTTATTSATTRTTPPTPSTAAPVPTGVGFVEEGDAIARLQMPTIGADWIVVAGIDRSDLQRGPGHYPGTPMPGQLGNSAIAGHRTTYGEPFADIDELAPGDELVVTTVAGTYVYVVEGTQIVGPGDGYVVATTDPAVARLTLTSCHPRYSASQRIVVSALLAGDRSSPPGEPVIDYGRPADTDDVRGGEEPVNTLPGDGTVDRPGDSRPEPTSPDSSTPRGTGPDDTSPAPPVSDAPATSAAAPSDEGGAPGPRAPVDDSSADAFGEGWFAEPGALVHVAFWGALLAAIAVGGYLVSRRYRNDWIGPLVAAAPFVVVLYFVFQNINRLLPAAL